MPYTGTKDEPDTVSLFFKNSQNKIFFRVENIHDALNYNPLNFVTAIRRIQEAVHKIFLSLRGKERDLWNATKNLTRGVVALIPLAGNAALYLYDRIRTRFYTHCIIKKALSNQNGPLLGIAFDGKIIKTFTLNQLSTALKGQPSNPLGSFHYLWLRVLEKSASSNITRRDVANKLGKMILS